MLDKAEFKLKCLEFIVNNPKLVNTTGNKDTIFDLTDNLYKFLMKVKDDDTNDVQ